MKRMVSLILCAALLLCAAPVLATGAEPISFADLANISFFFSSGVGAWYTELHVDEHGAFTGVHQDSDMGDTEGGYPLGTLYRCSFHGQLAIDRVVDEYTVALSLVSLEADEDVIGIEQEEGVRYVPSEPYGLTDTQELLLYLPGTPLDHLPQGFMDWMHSALYGYEGTTLPFFGLYNPGAETGFVGEEMQQPTDAVIIGGADGPTSIFLAGSTLQSDSGWTLPETPHVEGVPAEVFAAATAQLTGLTLQPAALLAVRDTGAVDYCYLCERLDPAADTPESLSLVYIHQALNGDTEITAIMDFPSIDFQ